MERIDNPPMPYWGRIPNGLQPGKMITILGSVNHGTNRFEIDFVKGNSRDNCDMALHFNPRFDQRVVVRNSFENGKWKNEEREPYTLPFSVGKDFTVIFLIESTHFKIAVNGRHYAEFKHRLPYQTIDKLNIEGGIRLFKIEYSFESFRPHGIQICPPAPTGAQVCPPAPTGAQVYPPAPTGMQIYPTGVQVYPPAPTGTQIYPTGVQVYPPAPTGAQIYPPGPGVQICPPAPSVAQICTKGPYLPTPPNSQPVYNPKMPFSYNFYNGITPGTMFYISGRVTAFPNSFSLEFKCRTTPPADIAFHFNPRFSQKIVVRNSLINNKWGEEERYGGFPFSAGTHFDMIIRVENDKYMVAVNGTHFTEYRHRVMPLSRMFCVELKGDIVLSCFKMSK